MNEPFTFAAFRSRHQVMRFDSFLREAGIRTQIINTPHEVALGCGLSVKIENSQYRHARQIYDKNPSESVVGFYQASFKNGKLVCQRLS